MKNQVKVIAFDADDTLWTNEVYFQDAEKEFCSLLKDYADPEVIKRELFEMEMSNLSLYGYGVKGFTLCMIETITKITGNTNSLLLMNKVLMLGKALLQQPVVLLEGVAETLERLNKKYILIVATKGDLLDQERKLKNSGLGTYFHSVNIMSDKKVADYQKLLRHVNCAPAHFLMVGNSVKSDILPVLELQGYAAHVPYKITWLHEQHSTEMEHPKLIRLNQIQDVLSHLNHDEDNYKY